MELCLLPTPARMKVDAGSLHLDDALVVVSPSPTDQTLFSAQQLLCVLRKQVGGAVKLVAGDAVKTGGTPIRLGIDASAAPSQGYQLHIRHDGIVVIGGDEAGLFYAVQTLIQILRQKHNRLPLVHIEDAPEFPARGVMLDISRDKVPTLQTLLDLVAQLLSSHPGPFTGRS